MKRYIKANTKIEKDLRLINDLATDLANVASASTEGEIEAAINNCSYPAIRHISDRRQCNVISEIASWIQEIADDINDAEYKKENSSNVAQALYSCLSSAGGEMKLITDKGTTDLKGDYIYRLMPGDAYPSINDMNRFCKAVLEFYEVEYDTPLGGSWTSHSSNLNGIDFYIGFARDYEMDPQTGQPMSIFLTVN